MIDISKRKLLASAAVLTLAVPKAKAQTCTPPCFPRTSEEINAGVVPSDLQYPAGDVRRYGPTADGAMDDTVPLQNAFDVAGPVKLVFPKGRTYAVGFVLTIPAGLDVDFNGCTIKRTTTDASLSFQLSVGAGAIIRNLVFEVGSGASINRGINLADGAKAYNVKIMAQSQQNNTGDKQNAAFNINGDDTEVIGLAVENFDYAVRCEDSNDGRWSNILISSYARAFQIETCSRFCLSDYVCHTRSGNAATNPGHDGLLCGEIQFCKFSNIDIRDSGEHGIYVSGGPTNNQHIGFSNIRVTRPGQCGMKLLHGSGRTQYVEINGLQVIDCHWGNRAGTNEDGLRIQNADYVVVTGLSVSEQDGGASAFDGIYINNCTNVTIVAPTITDVARDGIRIEDAGVAADHTNIHIVSPWIDGTAGSGINIDADTSGSELAHIVVTDAYIANASDYAVTIDTTGSVITAPVVVTGRYFNAVNGGFNNAGGVNVTLLSVDLAEVS